MSCFERCEAAAVTTDLSMSMGSGKDPDEPDDVRELAADKELGVEAADEAADEAAEEDLGSTLLPAASVGRLADIQGWLRRSFRLGLSEGLILRHLRMMSWHSWVSLVRNRTSAVQMASSFS